jgi:hypothetical protein
VALMSDPTFPKHPRMPSQPLVFDAAAQHNATVGKIVSDIIDPIMKQGGTTSQIMVLTESVLVGVALACIKLGGDELVLDHMFGRAKERLVEIRLKDIKTEGKA